MSVDSDCETTKISMAKSNRRIAKPIMEKKRRARINASLNELKTLLVEVLQKEGCRHSSKMEKADILEMAVRHLKNLQCKQPYAGGPTLRDSYPPAIPLEKFAASLPPDCLTPEMGRFLGQTDSKSKSDPTSPDSTTSVKLDSNRNILPAPQPVNISPHIIHNPVMTRTARGEIAVVLPQHVLKQAGTSNGGLIVPIYSLPSMEGESAKESAMPIVLSMPLQQSPNSAFSQTQSSASSVASSVTSSPPPTCQLQAPVSPVWRPW